MANVLKKFFHEFENITDYYNFLVGKTKNHEYVEITNEWLIDNYYLLVEHKNGILNSKTLIKKNKKIINDNYYFLKNIVSKKNYNISFKYLINELKEYQTTTKKEFSYNELSTIFPLLVFIYTEKLDELCKTEYQKILNKEKVINIIKNHENLKLDDLIPESFNIANNTHYIFEINNKLYKAQDDSNKLFKELNEYLQSNNISLKELVNEEYQKKIENDILISNIFSDFKEFF